ncbi:MAG: DUF5605 domain-containing protein [Eubacteriales bacterium]|nr:DUF5605 domain-containing protein [Eubacteriales bacterium]
MSTDKIMAKVERWGVFEITLPGRADGNPFIDYEITGTFTGVHEQKTVNGFYDGDGSYVVRFMPSFEGSYEYKISGNFGDEASGSFVAIAAGMNNHGPLRVRGCQLEYEDGNPYFSVGTTCYAWTMQSEETQEDTLRTLAEGYFNKIRMCIFPKHYLHNLHEPASYPFEGTPCEFSGDITGNFMSLMGVQPGNDWDFTKFNPEHFRNFEKRVGELSQMGIQADVILLHPYDRWGFSTMTAEQNDRYLRYAVARLAAYRNVWWSMANEYDLLRHLTVADWERMAQVVYSHDPYNHLRGIHNCFSQYDHSRPWITHCSIQREDIYKCAELVDEYRIRYKKPVALDEIGYEGNIDQGWGNLSGQELVRRFWEATCRGGYAGHGETYLEHETLWWSHGGKLFGESQQRIKFLHDEILSHIPGSGLKSIKLSWDEVAATVDNFMPSGYYLIYYGFFRPSYRYYYFDDNVEYQVEVIDTWNMTITDAGRHQGRFKIDLPGHEYMAVRIQAVT